jgi:hypothetical protein
MHGASASTPLCHNVASVAAASVTMDAANAFGLAGAAQHNENGISTAAQNDHGISTATQNNKTWFFLTAHLE